jgi:hypothetical protein
MRHCILIVHFGNLNKEWNGMHCGVLARRFGKSGEGVWFLYELLLFLDR